MLFTENENPVPTQTHLPTSGPIDSKNYNENGNGNGQATNQSSGRNFPTSLLVLLIFLVLQILLAIALLVIEIVFGYIGFDNTQKMSIDATQCTNYTVLIKYFGNQIRIMAISLVFTCIIILLSIPLLIITARALHISKRLPPQAYLLRQSSILLTTLYHLLAVRVRAAMYILQSVCTMGAVVPFGYYLSYWINLPESTCVWTMLQKNQKIIVLWVIAGVLFLVCLICWVIISIINIKNSRQEVYRYELSQGEQVEYKNLNTTEPNNTKQNQQTVANPNHAQQQKPQRVYTGHEEPRQEQPYIIRTNPDNGKGNGNVYTYNPTTYKEPQRSVYQYQPNNNINNQKEGLKASNVGVYVPGNYQANNYKPVENQNKPVYTYQPKNSRVDNNGNNYQNPVFKSRKDFYQSPYRRIENGQYYQGDKPKQKDAKERQRQMQLQQIDPRQKQKQFKRSRFSPKNHDYNPYGTDKPGQQQKYYRQLSRYRLQDPNPSPSPSPYTASRNVQPDSNYKINSPNSSNNRLYEGSKPRLHSNYFKEQTSLANQRKKQNDGSDDKKKRKGILNDYIRGKYTDN